MDTDGDVYSLKPLFGPWFSLSMRATHSALGNGTGIITAFPALLERNCTCIALLWSLMGIFLQSLASVFLKRHLFTFTVLPTVFLHCNSWSENVVWNPGKDWICFKELFYGFDWSWACFVLFCTTSLSGMDVSELMLTRYPSRFCRIRMRWNSVAWTWQHTETSGFENGGKFHAAVCSGRAWFALSVHHRLDRP